LSNAFEKLKTAEKKNFGSTESFLVAKSNREMKMCPYCGKEYPDDAVVCELDENPLVFSKPKPLIHSTAPPKRHQPITASRILSIFGFSVLSGLCGIGLTSVVLGIFVNHNPHFKNNGDRLGFLADNMSVFVIGGIIGFIIGLVISIKVAKADPKTEEEVEKKYVGVGGRAQIYSGAFMFLIAVLGKMFFEKLINAAGTATGTWIAFGIAAAIFVAGLVSYDHVPAKIAIPIGIIGWLLTLSMILWFAVFQAWR
jgi:hypothetical protein